MMDISIKLPDFFKNNSLNRLKRQMGVEKHVYGTFGNSQSQGYQIQLATTGIDIEDLSQLTPLDDHTLTFKGQRIILYIRDVNNWSDEINLPKFHVANCQTLQKMQEQGRKKRYVVSQNESDIFHLNLVNGKTVKKTEQKLDVCKNCLETLHWNNYSKRMSYQEKNNCVNNFRVEDFFIKYPKSFLNKNGYSEESSSINRYNEDWKNVSDKYKDSKKWTCENCRVVLSSNRYLLHTHHINGQKNDNSINNLMALCVECHANQSMHSHMRKNPATSRNIREVRKIKSTQKIK